MRIALGEVGVKEEPLGSNSGPRVSQYTGGRAQPWCAHFVSWCFAQTGQSPFGHISYVPTLRNWAKRQGVYHPTGSTTPEPGDVFTMPRYDRNGKLVGGHTGFVVEAVSSGTRVRTVEGNVSDGVKRLERSVQQLDGFIRL